MVRSAIDGARKAMTWQIEHSAADGVVMVGVSGEAGLDELQAIFVAGASAASEHGVRRILVDAREMALSSSTTELYSLPGRLREQGLTRAHKVAIVFSGDPDSNKDLLFLETVFFNRGFPMRLFPAKGEAITWLKRTKGPARPKGQS